MHAIRAMTGLGCGLALVVLCGGKPYDPPNRAAPGDVPIAAYLQAQAEALDAAFAEDLPSRESWEARRPRLKQEYFSMLGLWPLPARTSLEVRVTGTYRGEGFAVDLLHFQSRPRLYVTANLYRPAAPPRERLPAVLCVCGHSHMERNGNKTAYQAWGIWLARHGYVCLMLDTLQLGEIAAKHHGTYNLDRWHWHSRGYTPAGVECWNGIRAIDYLCERTDVDPARIAVTGISGGGAATFWIAAADERVAVAVPTSGMADLASYVGDRVINGHCDCMFLYNHHRWPWTRIAALVAPRPLLFVNSDADAIFPMDANERISNRLERLYSLYGAGERFETLVSVGGHAYRPDIRAATYRFLNLHLKGDARPVTDGEIDIVQGSGQAAQYPIPPERLRVFPTDADLPADELNTTIDEHFVPRADLNVPAPGQFDEWQRRLCASLAEFGLLPLPPGAGPGEGAPRDAAADETLQIETEPGIIVLAKQRAKPSGPAARLVLVAAEAGADEPLDWLSPFRRSDDEIWVVEQRGLGAGDWTRNNPPNYVERSLVLVGQTADRGRMADLAAAGVALRRLVPANVPLLLAGRGAAGLRAAYAAALCSDLPGSLLLVDPPVSHLDDGAPQLLSILRACDVPDVLGLLAPRELSVLAAEPARFDKLRRIYAAAGATDRLRIEPSAAGQ